MLKVALMNISENMRHLANYNNKNQVKKQPQPCGVSIFS